MRVTNTMMVGNFLRNLNVNTEQLDELQEQLSSGKRLNKPSDDPVAVVVSLRMRSILNENDKYLDNVGAAQAWLETTDLALGQANNVLQRVRELTIQGATDVLTPEARNAIAQEVVQLRDQLIQVANSTYDGRYIFAGFQTLTVPFDNTGTYFGDGNQIKYEISVSNTIDINIPGDSVFQGPVDMFQLLTDIATNLTAGNTANLSGPLLGQVDTAMNNLLTFRAEAGAKINRLELTKARLEDTKANYSNLLSKNEDIDIPKTITDLKMQESTYRASLASGARIIQPTLVDFLR